MSTEHYSEPTRPTYVEDDEITLRELILKIQEFFQELLQYWWLIVGFIVVATALFFANTYFSNPVYKAETTFMLNGESGRSGGQLGGLLGQFGLGGGGGGSSLSPAKIIELSKSRQIIQQVLFQKTVVDSTEDFFANHFIRELDLHEKWEDTKLEGLLFTQDSVPIFSLEENAALRNLHSVIINGNDDMDLILEIVSDDKAGIMELNIYNTSEELAYQFADAMYNVMQKYYVQQSIEPQQQTYNAIKQKVDSLNRRLAYLENALANTTDSNYGTYSASSQIRREHLQRELTFTASAYGEAIKNMEVASFSLETAKPVFQVVDTPLLPLPKDKSSLLLAIVLGVALGGFLGASFVIGRKIFRDVMTA